MAQAQQGQDLEIIQTEALGFRSIKGEAKIRLTPSWGTLPSHHASLLTVASRRGLVAAAGPDAVVLANTEKVRKAFENDKDGTSEVRPFEPDLRIPMSMRVSHIAFTADENLLLLSAETGGGLAVYEVENLLMGTTQSAFELGSNGESLRAVAPNPTRERAELCAVVTTNGNMYMVNLKTRNLSQLKDQVCSVSWSPKGKQLVAGLVDGTVAQMTPEGEVKAVIPRPPNVPDNNNVSSVTWLETNLWIAIYTSNINPPESVYSVITRNTPAVFTFNKLNDPVDPYGSEKPLHHSVVRLRDFAPHLTDLLIVTSTASTDVGLLSRSKQPLSQDTSADLITNIFTLTEMADDTKRATIPMTESLDDSLPTGIALDLSAKETVYRPIPTDEDLEESPGPLPGFWLLTHGGVLCAWWIIYFDSVRQGLTYSGMASGKSSDPTPATPAPVNVHQTPVATPSGASTFGSATPIFGGSSTMGGSKSPWSGTGGTSLGQPTSGQSTSGQSAFGQPSFGQTAFAQPSFGQSAFGPSSSGIGGRTSIWGAPAVSSTGSPFGQSGFASFKIDDGQKSKFVSVSSGGSRSGGFASFASSGGFASLGSSNNTNKTLGKSSGGVFGSGGSLAMDTDTAFLAPKSETQASSVLSAFKLGSSFKLDIRQTNEPANSNSTNSSMFDSASRQALGEAVKPIIETSLSLEQDEMSVSWPTASKVAKPEPKKTGVFGSAPSSTPSTTPAAPKFGTCFGNQQSTTTSAITSAPASNRTNSVVGSQETTVLDLSNPVSTSGLFGLKPPTSTPGSTFDVTEKPTPAPPESASSSTFQFEDSNPSLAASHSLNISLGTEVHLPSDFLVTPAKNTECKHSSEPEFAPLPPDFTKNMAKTDAPPLSPDFFPSLKDKPASVIEIPSTPTVAPLPDDEDGFSEGSGVDVANELSPSSLAGSQTHAQTYVGTNERNGTEAPRAPPQRSFNGISSPFDMQVPEGSTQSGLSGEVIRSKVPTIPQLQIKSLRPPSPLRGLHLHPGMPPSAVRSSSAPGMASQLLSARSRHKQFQAQPPPHTSIMAKPIQAGPDPMVQAHRQSQARREAEEHEPLVDAYDDSTQRHLASQIAPTKEIVDFIAHTGPVPEADQSIPSQVEAVYRDINAMLDSLAINSRALTSFIQGHMELGMPGDRTTDNLDDPDDWIVNEIFNLNRLVERDLATDLDDGNVKDKDHKLSDCSELLHNLHFLRQRRTKLMETQATAHDDSDPVGTARHMALPPDLAMQQTAMRNGWVSLENRINDVQEALTVLKAHISTAGAVAGTPHSKVPTIDAIIRTINKMTGIAEKRSGDVDVLENQMRKLGLGSANPSRSQEGTPASMPAAGFATPRMRLSVGPSSLLSPESSSIFTVTPRHNLRASLAASVSSTPRLSIGPCSTYGSVTVSPVRKTVSGYSSKDKIDLVEKQARRKTLLKNIEEAIMKDGVVKVFLMDGIE